MFTAEQEALHDLLKHENWQHFQVEALVPPEEEPKWREDPILDQSSWGRGDSLLLPRELLGECEP